MTYLRGLRALFHSFQAAFYYDLTTKRKETPRCVPERDQYVKFVAKKVHFLAICRF